MTLTGVVQNFGGLLAVRLLLGIFEYVQPPPSISLIPIKFVLIANVAL